MVSIPGALIGAALDRRDGDSGIKGALLGGLAPATARKVFPILGAIAFGLAARYALKRAGLNAQNTGPVV